MPKTQLEEETELIAYLREAFKVELELYPDSNTQWNLARFCRARNHDAKKTEKMLRNYFNWRRTKNIQAISAMPLDVFQPLIDAHETGLYGATRDGRPIVIERLGVSNVKVLLDPKYDSIREDYMLRLYEGIFTIVFPIASKTVGRRVDQLFIIYDVQGVNISKIFDAKFKKFMKFMIATVQDYYPEILGKLFIVNASLMIKSAWTVVRPWLDKKTRDKIELHSGVPLEALSKYVDVSSLPTFLGGQNTTPLKENSGPWKEHVDRAFQRKTFILEDRSPEFEYFYTEEEKQAALKRIEQGNFYSGGTGKEKPASNDGYHDVYAKEVKVMESRLINHVK